MRYENQVVLDMVQPKPSEHAVTAKHTPVKPAAKSPKPVKMKD